MSLLITPVYGTIGVMGRWILFFITIAIGAAAGLYYGWAVNPVRYVDVTPNTLATDYKTDYVLMVAEAYRADADLDQAMHRLAFLGDPVPLQSVINAIDYAEQAPYADSDLAMMRSLADALRAWNPALEIPEQ